MIPGGHVHRYGPQPALIASQALAQSYDPELGTGNIVAQQGQMATTGQTFTRAYAYVPQARHMRVVHGRRSR